MKLNKKVVGLVIVAILGVAGASQCPFLAKHWQENIAPVLFEKDSPVLQETR